MCAERFGFHLLGLTCVHFNLRYGYKVLSIECNATTKCNIKQLKAKLMAKPNLCVELFCVPSISSV